MPKDVCLELLTLATINIQFSFNSTMFTQIDEVAMGSLLGPIVAHIFVGYQEHRLFQVTSKPQVYLRYGT